MRSGGPRHLALAAPTAMIILALVLARGLPIIGVNAATATITQTSSGLVASDSLTTGNTASWTIAGNAPAGGSSTSENASGLYLGVRSSIGGSWAGWFAKSPNTNAMLFHAVLRLPYAVIPDNVFNTGLYVQTSSGLLINYVACVGVVGSSGYYWGVVQATGPSLAALMVTTLWASTPNALPLTQDCTIITDGNHYLKVYLGGNVVYQSNSLILLMPSPFNAYLEVQTNSASAMRFGNYVSYYATLNENVTVTNAPAGGTVKIVDSLNNVLASAAVASSGTAILPVGKYLLPLTANIQVYDSTGNLVASTPSLVAIWGGDVYNAAGATTTTSSTTTTSTTTTATTTSSTGTSTGITVSAHRIYASYWDPCFATTCTNPTAPCNTTCTGPGTTMYFVLCADASCVNIVQTGFANENGYTFTGLSPSATYYVYPDDCNSCHGSLHNVVFQYWGDGSTVRPRAAIAGANLDAWYSCTNNCA